jgi:bacterioferritin-associated ferredoxin
MLDDLFVCRCEEITREEIEQAIADGAASMNEVKRWTRAGMGLCQGKTCARQVMAILARQSGTPPAAIRPAASRYPVRPMEISAMTRRPEDG